MITKNVALLGSFFVLVAICSDALVTSSEYESVHDSDAPSIGLPNDPNESTASWALANATASWAWMFGHLVAFGGDHPFQP